MNALWTTRMCAYKNSPLRIETARQIIALKIQEQNVVLKKYKRPPITLTLQEAHTVQDLLLLEARAAKQFWRELRTLLPMYPSFSGRNPRSQDIVNRLLDIGYHHLGSAVKKTLTRLEVPADLGLLHVARKSDSVPLAYDLMELFRSDVVDAEVLRYLRLKKKPIAVVEQKEIGHFLHEINERLEKKHYLKDFEGCHTYRYYMELQILKFIKAVNHKTVFEPLHLPMRHDTRCSTCKNLTPSTLPATVVPEGLTQTG